MSKIQEYFQSYDAYHETRGNKLTHYLGIPMIVFSALGLLALLRWGEFDLAMLALLGASVFYIRLDWKRGLVFSLLLVGLYILSLKVDWRIHLFLFVFGWILQGVGHYVYEKKSPAFLTNLSHLLIGPFWIFCRFWSGPKPS